MKLLILLENDHELDTINGDNYGLAITWWKRPDSDWWQWGCRLSILFGQYKPYVRLATYALPLWGIRSYIIKKAKACAPRFE